MISQNLRQVYSAQKFFFLLEALVFILIRLQLIRIFIVIIQAEFHTDKQGRQSSGERERKC